MVYMTIAQGLLYAYTVVFEEIDVNLVSQSVLPR
jgi:hypothetical protein